MAKLTGYDLSRKWFDWCFENPEKVKPIHTALYFFAIEHCNRLGWKEKFGLPTEMSKDALGIKSWHTFISAFNDLVDWGFFMLIEKSKNQYSSNIIALIKNDEALDKALDKAVTKHVSKHQRSTYQSIDSIDKQIHNNTEPLTLKGEKHFSHIEEFFSVDYEQQQEGFRKNYSAKEYQSFQKFITAMLKEFRPELITKFDKCISIGDWKKYLRSSPYLVVRPFLVKVLGASDGDRNNMAARIATYSNGAFDDKVFIKAA